MASEGMDAFCGSPFWNASVTWYTNRPDLTECFQKTVLVWAPCVFLWVFAPLETYYILNSKFRNIPWNWLNISKLFLTVVLIGLSIADFGYALWKNDQEREVNSVEYYTPLIKLVSFILTAVLQWYNRQRGMRTSGLLFLFWFLLLLFGIVQYRAELNKAIDDAENEDYFTFITYLVYFPVVVILFLFNCKSDAAPRFSEYATPENPCPEQGASFLSRLFFGWFDALALKGFRRPLETKDLWNMNPEDTAHEIIPRFDKYWQKSVEKSANVPSPKASFHKTSASVDLVGKRSKKTQASVLPAVCKAFGATFLFGSLLKLVQDLLTFASPQILKLLISYVSDDTYTEEWKGYFYAVLMFLAASIQTLFLAQYFNRMFLVGLRIRTALVSAIYRKALRLSSAARKESTVGEIVNLMSVDAQRFMDLTAYLSMLWSAPLQIALALYFLWDTLGPSVLAGLAVMIILIPVNGVVANRVKVLQIRQMKNKDERVKLMNEVLSGIKVLKLYAWEPSFEQQVLKIRDKEIHVLKQAAYLNAATSFIWSCAPFLVSLVTFTTYVMISEDNVLNAQKAFVSLTLFNIIRMPMSMLPMLIINMVQVSLVTFATFVLSDERNILDSKTAFVSLSLFNILRFPLSMLPMLISNLVQASVSIKRMNKFMNSEELDPNNVTHDNSEKHPLLIENGTFSWGPEDDPILRNINLHFSSGSLVAVVGSVGSGKSSLISAFLGEMEKLTGRVNTKGSIAFVPQQAWIQNATLQDNIVFGRSMDQTVYKRVVEACALKPDFDMLPGGDQTEIGEKGINLSGGQKQRVSLARAVYNNADVYFLDDPLSAVDSHVGKHIFENVIGPSGLLKKKTRVLVTHGITFLPEVDQIVVLKDGEVTEMGTYKELLEKKGAFADFLLQHLQEGSGDDSTSQADLDELKQQLESTMGAEELQQKLIRARSRISESDSGSVSEKRSLSRSGSLQRQTSVESNAEKRSLSRLNSEKDGAVKAPVVGEKLIETEKAETGSVKWSVYSHYLKSIGLVLAVSTLLFNVLFQAFSIGSNMWLSRWSTDLPDDGTGQEASKRDMYLGVYGALGVGQAVSVLILSLTIALGTLVAAAYLHDSLLTNVLHNPMSFFDTTPVGRIVNRFAVSVVLASVMTFVGGLKAARVIHLELLKNMMKTPLGFFDVTPVGRILNRFSKDVDTLDTVLPMIIRGFLSCLVSLMQNSNLGKVKLQCGEKFFLLAAIFSFFCDLSPQLGCWRAAVVLQVIMLSGVLRAPLTFFDVTPSGRILGRFSKDIDILDNTLPRQVSDSLYCFFEVVATLFVISYSTPIFISVIVPVGILYYFVQRFYVATSRQLKRLESVSRSPIYSHFGESITGASTIRAYGVQSRFILENESKVDFNQICYYPTIIANRWLAVRLEMVGNLIILFAALFAVMQKENSSEGDVGLSISYALQITQTLNWLVRMTSDVETNIVAVERIKEYSETPQEAEWDIPSSAPPPSWPDEGAVDFKDYQVRYREGLELVLKGVTFSVKGGEKVGIVGRTGAGKSSLTLALFRIIEAAGGSILIDGQDISKMGLHALRSRLTIIPQDPVLFSGTLRINLDPFGLYSDDDVWRALEHAHLKSFVKGLAAGLSHEVSEGGENLSVGQRQLICLARALLRKTKVLVLDEATAAVDLETDDLIQYVIANYTIRYVHWRLRIRVIVLDRGNVVEYDTPDALLQRKSSVFYGMAKDAGLL
ncbi:Multidrug resistance protein homolog 49 [Gryllus bimaculatus]|nr:Multidrug resistance protein homolog 49 [Gryllus bimaculatus]